MGIFIMIDPFRRASAWSIIVVILYFGYSLAEKKVWPNDQAALFRECNDQSAYCHLFWLLPTVLV
jgi:hypothetical protein